jgi:hypothetical protein
MLRFLLFTRRRRLGDPIRISGVQPGGSLAGKVSSRLRSIFSSVDSATVIHRRPLAGRLDIKTPVVGRPPPDARSIGTVILATR